MHFFLSWLTIGLDFPKHIPCGILPLFCFDTRANDFNVFGETRRRFGRLDILESRCEARVGGRSRGLDIPRGERNGSYCSCVLSKCVFLLLETPASCYTTVIIVGRPN